jgi:hypothetical protein
MGLDPESPPTRRRLKGPYPHGPPLSPGVGGASTRFGVAPQGS